MKFFFNSSNTEDALLAKNRFINEYGQHEVEKADIIIPIGGDGFLLKNLHNYNELNIPFFWYKLWLYWFSYEPTE